MMSTLAMLAKRVAVILADDECDNSFVRWHEKDIIHWLLEGYAVASTVARHQGTEIVEVSLVEGAVQTLPSGYSEFIRVINNTNSLALLPSTAENKQPDRYANVMEGIETSGECDADDGSAITIGFQKQADGSYVISHWQAEPLSANTFYVDPAVPRGYTGSVKVLAIKDVDMEDTTINIPNWAYALVINWALYRAWSIEMESQYSAARSDTALKNFYELLTLYRPRPPQIQTSRNPQYITDTAQ